MKNLYLSITSCVFAANFMFAQSVVLQENFDAGIPANFIQYNEDGLTPAPSVAEYTSAWIAKEDPDNAGNMVASATSFFAPIGMADRWLITPSLTLGAFGNHFSWSAKSHDASYPERYLVLMSTTDTQIESFTDTIARVVNEDVEWTNHTYDLSDAGFNNQNVHFAFVLRSIDGFKFYLDSIQLRKEDPLHVQEMDELVFSVYPNPVTDVLHVSTDVHVEQLVIRNLNGSVVGQSSSSKVDVRHLNQGVYFVELYHASGIVSKRFVKQ